MSAGRNRSDVPTWECPVDDSVVDFSRSPGVERQLDRPLRLFERPEPASWTEEEIRWRGVTFPIESLLGPERLQSDWWAPEPLDRDYYVLDLANGDRLWLFEDPKGRLYVQGCFD